MNDAEDLSRMYAAAVDARAWDAAAALFTEDGVLVVPNPPEKMSAVEAHHGRAEIRAAFAELEGTDSTRHEVLGVEPDGRVACLAHHVIGTRCVDWHLHYVDTYESGLFSRRELHLDRIEIHPV